MGASGEALVATMTIATGSVDDGLCFAARRVENGLLRLRNSPGCGLIGLGGGSNSDGRASGLRQAYG